MADLWSLSTHASRIQFCRVLREMDSFMEWNEMMERNGMELDETKRYDIFFVIFIGDIYCLRPILKTTSSNVE
jgi:hypothetical protein